MKSKTAGSLAAFQAVEFVSGGGVVGHDPAPPDKVEVVPDPLDFKPGFALGGRGLARISADIRA